ncbi:MAG TPA: winged helix-turn-helix domain-containing protein [Candidatus Cybelea sp.]|nr:winged helix-turn-helix domain-containing protein [Candidatus Cybelea sp.]
MMVSPNAYLFGRYRLDAMRRLLFCGAVPTPVPERLFQLLLVLIQSDGKVVDRDTISHRVWGEEGVTDSNLAQHVYLLRLLLGERGKSRSYILTVPGKGYRFAATVTPAQWAGDELVAESALSAGKRLMDGGLEIFARYCRGSALLERRTAPALFAALEAFEEALRLDPNYTPALIGVARSHALLAEYWHVPGWDAFPKAKTAIDRALELDPHSSTAHAVLSELLLFRDWDWVRAEEEVLTAISLNPQSTFARNNAAWFYVFTGQYAKALAHAQQALMVDAASLPLQLLLARALVHSGEYARGIAIMSNLLDSDPEFYIARRYRAQAYLLCGQPALSIEDLETIPREPSEDPSFRLPMLARAYAELGDVPRAKEIYTFLQTLARSQYVVWWNLAIVAMGLGLAGEALGYLKNALRDREPTLLSLCSLPWFKPISEHAEFKRMLREIWP